MKPVLEIKNYTKIYGEAKKAADNVCLTVEAGDIYGFIGHNGAGKSTTIRAVVGVLDFTEGEILIDGHSVKSESVECKKITSYIPDNPDLYEVIKKYADAFEITDSLGDLISSYSHGMKQKLAIISALIHEPKLIVMDEPFVGLDPKAAFTLKQIMHEMCKNGAAIFFSTHVLDVAEKLCNKVAIIRKGKIVMEGEMDELVKDQSLEKLFLEVHDGQQ